MIKSQAKIIKDLNELAGLIPGWRLISGNSPFTHGAVCPLHEHSSGTGTTLLMAYWPLSEDTPVFACQTRCIEQGILKAVSDRFRIWFSRTDNLQDKDQNPEKPPSIDDLLNMKRWIGIDPSKRPATWQGGDGNTYVRIHSHTDKSNCIITDTGEVINDPVQALNFARNGGEEEHAYLVRGRINRRTRTVLPWEDFYTITHESSYAGDPAFCFTGDDCPPVVIMDVDPPKYRERTDGEQKAITQMSRWAGSKLTLTETSRSGTGTHIIFAIHPNEKPLWNQLRSQYLFNKEDKRGLSVDVRTPGAKAHIHITRDWTSGSANENESLPIVRYQDLIDFPIIGPTIANKPKTLEEAQGKERTKTPPTEWTSATYIKWADDAALSLRNTAKSPEKQMADLDRILEYQYHRVAVVRGVAMSDRTIINDILVEKPTGFWSWMSSEEGPGLIKMLLEDSASENKTDALKEMNHVRELLEASTYATWMHNRTRNWRTASHLREMVSQVKTWAVVPPDGIVAYSPMEIDDINNFPVIPLTTGGAISLEEDTIFQPAELTPFMLTISGWQMEPPDFEAMEWHRTHRTPEWLLVQRFSEVINRTGYNLRRSGKKADIFVSTRANYGKSAIASAMAQAIPAIHYIPEPSYRPDSQFTPLHRAFITHRVVIFDEAHDMGDVTRLVFDVTGSQIRMEGKGKEQFFGQRLGTAMFFGNDFPDIDATRPGLVREEHGDPNPRLAWILGKGREYKPLLDEDYYTLHADACQNIIRSMLILAARADKPGLNQQTDEWVDRFIEERSNEAVTALKEKFVIGDETDFVTTEALKNALLDNDIKVPETNQWNKLVRRTFPDARKKREKGARGHSGIKARKFETGDE